jgi:hypothetical protein
MVQRRCRDPVAVADAVMDLASEALGEKADAMTLPAYEIPGAPIWASSRDKGVRAERVGEAMDD